MGPPVESHIARAPVPASVSRKTTYIPDDFNPFALGGIAHRNSSDPLAPLGRNAQGLTDVAPEHTLDSIYAPGAESPTSLVMDPLDESRARALQVEQSVDPMRLFSSSDKTGVLEGLSGGAQSDNAKSMSDHALEMGAFFRAPAAKMDTALQTQAAGSGTPGLAQFSEVSGTEPPVQTVPEQGALAAAMGNPQTRDVDEEEQRSCIVSPASIISADVRTINQEPSSNEKSLDNSGPQASIASSSIAKVTPPITESLTAASNSRTWNVEELIAAFKRGAGLEDGLEQAITPELMETIGQMLQTAVQGAISLLAARATVKQEIHLSVTLINPKSNNPLKFLPDGPTALLQMLGPRMPGFMKPVDAMKEAFDDLITHQTAIAAGTQAAVEALFQRFAPDLIESQNPRNGVGEKMSGALYYARLWSIYKGQYRTINNEVKDDFFRILGSDFHDAYSREYDSNESGKQ
jgi:FHA domain-containing protein